MPCYTKLDDNGHRIIVTGKLGPRCNQSGCGWVAGFLCDFPMRDGGTCDRPLCEDHAHQVARNTHYCAVHLDEWQGAGGGMDQMKLL